MTRITKKNVLPTSRRPVDPNRQWRQDKEKVDYRCSNVALGCAKKTEFGRQLEKLRVFPRVCI